MTLKANFNINDVKNYIAEKAARFDKAIIQTYQFAGEEFVRTARLKTAAEGGFNDITGNLRSSIGYIIIKNGEQLAANFIEADNGTDGATGKEQGLAFAIEIAAEFPKGIVLIAVAGMEYAAAVESKLRDVITGSVPALETRLKQLLKQL